MEHNSVAYYSLMSPRSQLNKPGSFPSQPNPHNCPSHQNNEALYERKLPSSSSIKSPRFQPLNAILQPPTPFFRSPSWLNEEQPKFLRDLITQGERLPFYLSFRNSLLFLGVFCFKYSYRIGIHSFWRRHTFLAHKRLANLLFHTS